MEKVSESFKGATRNAADGAFLWCLSFYCMPAHRTYMHILQRHVLTPFYRPPGITIHPGMNLFSFQGVMNAPVGFVFALKIGHGIKGRVHSLTS